MPLLYRRIEEQLAEALPEIRPAAERYWRAEGPPGADSGPYIFIESMFATYLEVLLALNASPTRDHLLRRAFSFVDEMLQSQGREVANLAVVGIFEGRAPWWWVRVKPYLSATGSQQLDRFEPDWRLHASSDQQPTLKEKRDIIDLFGVRSVIMSELAADGVAPDDVPGVTHTGT
jgi:hypothetical protein